MSTTALALLLGVLQASGPGVPRFALPAPGTAGWQPFVFPRIERHTRYERAQEGAQQVLRAVSECAASAWMLSLEDVDLGATPRLRWRWRIEKGLAARVDERTREGDDFAARVYVTFVFVPERASLLQRVRRRLAAAVYGQELPGSALNYVWSRAQPAGATWENPFAPASRMVSLGSGPIGEWRAQEVDLLADYERLFGAEAPAPLFLALMTDSDDTCGEARASYAEFELLGRARDAW